MSILDRIVEQKKREVARLPNHDVTTAAIHAACVSRGGVRDFVGALAGATAGNLSLIAEVKKASPSAGIIRAAFDPVKIALEYERAGAHCLSVLTDETFFQGSLDYLGEIRRRVLIPVLRKDFMIDRRQILEAAEAGADAILLIVAILSQAELIDMHQLALGAGLAVLVEVHDEEELERALDIGPRLIGVNNRNLKTFQVDLGTTEVLAKRIAQMDSPPLLVAESGIHARADVERLARAGARAMLVGESIMRQENMGAKIHELLGR